MNIKKEINIINKPSPEQKKDIYQLLLVTKHYLQLSRDMFDEGNEWFDKYMYEIGENYANGYPSSENIKNATLVVANLASAASRICTIEETLGCKAKYNDCYNDLKNNPSENTIKKYICIILRDNCSHLIYPENNNYKDNEDTRRKILNDLTPKKIGSFVESYFRDLKKYLYENIGLRMV